MRRSLVLSFSEKTFAAVLSLVLMVIISRLLTPAELGLYLVASAGVILVETFRDFGVVGCIVQERELSRSFLRSAFSIVALLSALLGALLWGLSDWAAAGYGAPELGALFRVAALGFIFAPISSVRLALLRRDAEFGAVAAIGISANFAGAVVSVVLALLGYGAVSMVWGSVAAAAVSAAGALLARPVLETFAPALSEWRRILGFGAWSTAVALLGMLSENTPRLILGRMLGFAPTGLYFRAQSITQLPDRLMVGAVQPVILSDFAERARRSEPMDRSYLTALELIAVVQWPALACLAIMAEPLVSLLLGPSWMEVVPLLRIVAIAGMALCPLTLTYPVLVAAGRVRDSAYLNLALAPVVMLVIWLASMHSVTVVALSLLVLNPLQAAVNIWTVRRHLRFPGRLLAVGAMRCALVAALSAVPAVLLTEFGGPPVLVMVALAATLPCWVAGVLATRGPASLELTRLANRLRRRRSPV